MIPTKIFLDLDDVLNKFTMFALRYVGCPVSLDYAEYDREWGYDIIKAANALHPSETFTKDKFWNCFNQGAWASVPPSNEFTAIICASRAIVGTENVYILTRPVPYPGCLEGKRQWIKQYLPLEMEENYLIGRDKFLCAKEGWLLIDDVEKNVTDWIEKKGSVVLFPRPWNEKFGVDPGKLISDVFTRIGVEMQQMRDRVKRRNK